MTPDEPRTDVKIITDPYFFGLPAEAWLIAIRRFKSWDDDKQVLLTIENRDEAQKLHDVLAKALANTRVKRI